MKSRRRLVPLHAEVPFAYTLLGSIDINDDELLNFTGRNDTAGRTEIVEFLRNKSFAQGREAAVRRTTYLQFEAPAGNAGDLDGKDVSRRNGSFAAVEDATQHLWFISQRCSGATPFARNFSTANQFLQYAAHRSLAFPGASEDSATTGAKGVETETETTAIATPPVVTKWLDVQTTNKKLITELLSRFPLSQDTIDHCCYLDAMDRFHAHSALGYYFFNLMCTPITPNDEVHSTRKTKSTIQLHLDACMADQPRSSIPAPVPVAVVVFPDWIIMIHEKPFHEFDDLLKFVHVNCGVYGPRTGTQRPMQVMTSPFVFSSLFQIVVGHQLDTVSLIKSLDKIGDTVFHVEAKQEKREEVLQRITNVRRCLGECAAELTRREHIVSSLLQPHMADSFLTRDKVVCRQLESVRAHLLRLSDEVSDCRDTVSVTNWYHNVARTWQLLRRGNKALRQTLLFTELTNIMYPVIAIQTVYAMNVEVPFDSEGDPPVLNTRAFFVVFGVLLVYLLLCGRAVYALMHRKRWDTKLLTQ